LFLLSGGTHTSRPGAQAPPLTLAGLFARYREAHAGALEANTLGLVAIHERHLTATLGAAFPVATLALADLQRHVVRRSRSAGRRGKPLSPATVRKEIATFSSVWNWAARAGLVTGAFPRRGLAYPKGGEKPPFRTYAEIERQAAGLTPDAAAELWDCLFLTLPEVGDLLEYVRVRARHPWIYPMFCVAAHTGMRRSEILRAEVADFDFASGTVLVREKKRERTRRTTRRVPMSAFLAGALKDWFEGKHPGGRHAFCHGAAVGRPRPVSVDESNHHFAKTLEGGKWSVLRGWHVLRHSFATNCAAAGVDQRIINEWMGHQTEEMVRRYRHLIPGQERAAIQKVFG
jgi:integrase